MRQRFAEVSGFVLAGGESRRMGRPKPLLTLAGESMVERQVRLLRAVASSVAVIGPPELLPRLDVPVFPDDLPARGPLGGIATALARTHTELALVLGCDLPFVPARFLRFLVARALADRADVTVPSIAPGRLEPMCALYRRGLALLVRNRLLAGQNKVDKFFPRVRTRIVTRPEIARAGFSAAIFENMNTPEDYRAAQIRLGQMA